MPKRRILRSRRVGLSNTKSVMAKTVVVPFTDITTIQRTASLGYEISEIELKIASFGASSRVRVMAGLYEYFRFRKLSVEAITDTAMATVVVVADAKQYFPGYAHGLGFEPSAAADFTAVTSFDDLMQLPKSTMGPCHQRLRLSLSRANMQGSNPVKWFHTATTGTPPVADSVAGTLTYVSRTPAACSSQGTYSYIIIRGEVEFTAPLASGAAELTHTSYNEHRIPSEERKRSSFEDLRISVREDSFIRSSVPNTPTSNFELEPKGSRHSECDGRSNRQSERPRLVRQ